MDFRPISIWRNISVSCELSVSLFAVENNFHLSLVGMCLVRHLLFTSHELLLVWNNINVTYRIIENFFWPDEDEEENLGLMPSVSAAEKVTNNTQIDENHDTASDTEETKKKKNRKEKIGFRERKVTP